MNRDRDNVRRGRTRRLVAGAVLATSVLVTSACSAGQFDGIYDLPLPGGADLGENPYHVTVQFDDVLDLVAHSAVKVNNVPVGTVEDIRLGADGWTAEAILTINRDVVLPANAVARLRQSSLLGEKFVELVAPADLPADWQGPQVATVPGGTTLSEGDVIPLRRSSVGVEVEEIFGAMSMLFNGGGIGQLQTINRELSTVMDGNETEIKAFLDSMNEIVSNLDGHRNEITAALDGLDTLATTLAGRKEQISAALTDLSPGLDSLADQRTQLVTMLESLDELSTVAVDTINRSKADMVADLEALAPILRRLAGAGEDLPQALEILPTFPFTDPVLDAIKGDYLNVFVSVEPSEDFEQPIPLIPVPGDETGGTP